MPIAKSFSNEMIFYEKPSFTRVKAHYHDNSDLTLKGFRKSIKEHSREKNAEVAEKMWKFKLLWLALVLQGTAKRSMAADQEASPPAFICVDGSEIALANVCNGLPDCADSSDETMKLCHHIVCPSRSFRCAYGACTARSKRCDGIVDCVDGSDELFCDDGLDCDNQEFRCSNSRECISFSMICDGTVDCEDGSDEKETICKDNICPEYTFQCSYGGCVHQEVVCDGFKDCIDATDEEGNVCKSKCLDGDCSENESNSCSEDEFSCESGDECIPLERLCDGSHQCQDASDEKREICKDLPCLVDEFRCEYGACVAASSRCDRVRNCYDWSDEDEKMCGVELPEGACRLPLAKPGISYEVSGCKRCRPNQVVPEYTRLDYACHGNLTLEGPEIVHCQANKWIPSIPVCPTTDNEIKCPVVNSRGTEKSCKLLRGSKSGWTSCDHAAEIGTQVSLECNDFYERERGSSRVTCLHDGTWSQTSLSCKPICGVRNTDGVALIVKGWEAKTEEPVPWHATLFSHENGVWKFFCGATLIAESVVITAGHCVWKTAADTIRVVLASDSSNFTMLNENTQIHEVERIELQNSYHDHEGNYGSDLALLILKRTATINSNVLPACIDWSNEFDLTERTNEIGIVAGMGITENDTFSANLRIVSAQVVSHNFCREKQTRDFRKYLSYTAFCAGWANGTSVCNGDSGGGFLMKRPNSNLWEIQGIVSLSPRRLGALLCDPKYYTLFTKVSAYLKWIKKVIDTENKRKRTDINLIPNEDNIQFK